MSKKIKKLLSGLLVLSMIASSGIAAFADEPDTSVGAAASDTAEVEDEDFKPYDDVDEVEATEAPEADAEATAEAAEGETATAEPTEEPTEEPTATPEPTPVPSTYETDAYYKKALSLCQSLGIITGYDDGSVKPESTVTRAEMAAIILRMTATQSTSVYRNIFDDVTSSHWAADTIQTAADANVVNGMGDGTFLPDGDVLYEQALKMVVCGMNYQGEAEAKGGYPEGYLAVAAVNLRLLDGVDAMRGEPIVRGEIIKIVYNALLGPYHKITSYDAQGAPIYDLDDDTSLAKAKFDVYEEKGLLTGTHNTSITATKPAAGQISIDGDTYLCDLDDIDQYVASKITYYYVDNNKADPKVVAVVVDSAKTTETTIEADDIKKVTSLEDAKGEIQTEKGKTYKTDSAYIVYNGDLIDNAIYSAAVAADTTGRFDKVTYDGEATGEKLTYNEFLTPDEGSIRLVDNDGDGKYDVIFVDSYETLLVTTATDKRVIGKIKNSAVTIDVDTTENADMIITVVRDGSEAKAKNLKKNNVVSLKRNLDQDVMSFECNTDTVRGKITSFTAATDTDCAYITVNGTEYEVDYNAVSDCSSGLEVAMTFDKFGRVGYVESDSVKSASDKYGWILSAYLSDSGDGYMARIFTEDGSINTYEFASKVNFWGPGDTEATSGVDSNYISQALKTMNYNTVAVGGEDVDIRLVKFGTNSKGEITKIYFAKAVSSGLTKGSEYSSTTYDKKSLVVETTNLTSYTSTGNLVSRYYMSDGMLEFTVPNKNEDMNDTETYAVKSATASNYLNKENNIGKDFIVGEFSDDKQTYPTVLIRFEGSADQAKAATDYGTADNNPCFMLERIAKGVDEDDNVIYTLTGYQNGGTVKYTTKKNTTLAKFTGSYDDRNLGSTTLWDAIGGVTSDGKSAYPGAKSLTDIIGEGDVIGVAGSGDVLMLMVDASELAAKVKNGTMTEISASYSTSRDEIYVGAVQDSDLGNDAVMTVANRRVLFDAGRAMDTVIIDSVGSIDLSADNVSTIADVIDYNETYGSGDYAFVRYANKGNLQEIYIFRFED